MYVHTHGHTALFTMARKWKETPAVREQRAGSAAQTSEQQSVPQQEDVLTFATM